MSQLRTPRTSPGTSRTFPGTFPGTTSSRCLLFNDPAFLGSPAFLESPAFQARQRQSVAGVVYHGTPHDTTVKSAIALGEEFQAK